MSPSIGDSRNAFLTRRLILAIHRDQIENYGGTKGLRDEAMLESALEQPPATFGGKLLHQTVFDQAAAYLFHLVQNHPFVDGNKRVAFAAMDVFLRLNNLQLQLSDDDAVELVLRTATGELEKDSIGDLLRKHCHPIQTPE